MKTRGCPLYMAPELFSSDGVHSFSTDLWAVGCIIFELRISETPFTNKWFQDGNTNNSNNNTIQNNNNTNNTTTTPTNNNNEELFSSYQEVIDGSPQEILENIRKYQLSFILEKIIERYQNIEKNKNIQKFKSPTKSSNGSSKSQESYIPTMSPELLDLLSWMLEKPPTYRCNWEQLSTHPFWDIKSVGKPSPPETIHKQPAFEAMIR